MFLAIIPATEQCLDRVNTQTFAENEQEMEARSVPPTPGAEARQFKYEAGLARLKCEFKMSLGKLDEDGSQEKKYVCVGASSSWQLSV